MGNISTSSVPMKIILAILILLGCQISSHQLQAQQTPSQETLSQEALSQEKGPEDPGKTNLPARLPLNELRIFVEAFDRISSAYVEEIDDKTLLENAIKGMLSQLDPHSAYLDQKSFSNLQESTTGNYGGLGLEVGMEDGFIKVISPMDDTPADKAGIEAGDFIVEINGSPVKGKSLSEAIEDMRGKPGSEVKLTVLKDTVSQPIEVVLVREVIQVASVRKQWLDDGLAYIRIATFQSDTGPELNRAIDKLMETGNLSGVVLDLRNNPGGVLQSAIEVTDAFIDHGLIVYTSGRLPDMNEKYHATTPDSTLGAPIVVLVNGGTASASEIVAGALQDHQRAVIMGTNTFGKGSVQRVLPLNEKMAIKLTTALYYTPNGRSIQAEGIVPDMWVPRSEVTKLEENPFRLKERDLPNHLKNGNGTKSKEKDHESETDLASRDYQLNEALNLLKGLTLLDRHSQG